MNTPHLPPPRKVVLSQKVQLTPKMDSGRVSERFKLIKEIRNNNKRSARVNTNAEQCQDYHAYRKCRRLSLFQDICERISHSIQRKVDKIKKKRRPAYLRYYILYCKKLCQAYELFEELTYT